MPTGKPKSGFRRCKKYWEQARDNLSIMEVEKELQGKLPRLLEELEKLTKPIPCPNCGHTIQHMDKDVGMYLVDRVMGKPTQKHEVDITEQIILSGDQIDIVVERYRIAEKALLGEVIEGEYEEA